MKKRIIKESLKIAGETTVEEVEASNPDLMERGCWLYIKREMKQGDKICHVQNVRRVAGRSSGNRSIALVREGKVVAECMTAIVG